MKVGQDTWKWLAPLEERQRRVLLGGLGFTVLTVLLRLAMPWPLREFIRVANGKHLHTPFAPAGAHWHTSTPFVLASIFVCIIAMLGWAEMQQRILLKRYAAQSVHHLRAIAVTAAKRRRSHQVTDLVSRIIGDSARLKAELTGILVHGAQNTLYFLGIIVVFVFVSPKLAGIFLLGGLYTVAVGSRGQRRVARIARKQREREGHYAATLAHLDADPRRAQRINAQSASKDVRTTRLIMGTSWAIHVGFAALTAVALLVSLHEVHRGHMLPADLFLLIAYSLTTQRRLVHVGRQLARWGKVRAHTQRLVELIESSRRDETVTSSRQPAVGNKRSQVKPPRATEGRPPGLGPLLHELRLTDVRVGPHTHAGQRRQLRRTHLTIPAGGKIAVVGRAHQGRSVLLRVIAGKVPARGTIAWDGRPVAADELSGTPEVRFLPETPLFPRERLKDLLGLTSVLELEQHLDMARILSIDHILAQAQRGVDTKVSSTSLPRVEVRALLLFDWLREPNGSVWILDAVDEGLGQRKATAWINLIMERAGTRTVVLGLSRSYHKLTLDHVHHIRKRRVAAAAL